MPILKMYGAYDTILPLCSSGGTRQTNTAYYDANYVDNPITLSGGTSDYAEIILDSGITDLWVRWNAATWSTTNTEWVMVGNTDNSKSCRIYRTGSSNHTAQIHDGSVWTNQGNVWPAQATGTDIERVLHVKLDDTEGVFEYFEDGVSMYSYTGDTLLGGSTQLNRIRIGRVNGNTISEIVVGDQDLNGVRVSSKPVTADGAETGWSNGYDNIDEADANSARPGYASAVATYVSPDPYVSAPPEIPVVQVTIEASTSDDTVGADVSPVIRSGGTNYAGTGIDLTGTQTPYYHMTTVDPATGSSWTASGLNAAEPGVQEL